MSEIRSIAAGVVPFTVAVVGDVNLDISAEIGDLTALDATVDQFIPAPMAVRAAGTAGSFATVACEHFVSVHVFARVGADAIGESLIQALQRPGLHSHIARDPKRPSRVVLMLRGRSGPNSPLRRVMIPRVDVANDQLLPNDLDALYTLGNELDLLLIDGYSYLTEPARSTVESAVWRMADKGVPVAFDVVPHQLDARWTLEDLLSVLEPVSFVISEALTLERFLGYPGRSAATREAVEALVPEIRSTFGRSKTYFLRFGEAQIGQSLVVGASGEMRWAHTGYCSASDVAAFGDRLTARELREELSRIAARVKA